ncbi:MAG TPA: NADH-quinone oxidoreductase subunit A [Tepidisphaeraceae bacterium]|nr:NADH-quinone oxidoreductase subunit A [Tepidisphaeraceae bacterium]
MTLPLLAQAAANAATTTETYHVSSWLPVLLLLVIGIGFAVGNVLISVLIGPGRTGPGKEEVYESGMVPTGDTRQRFNVRFYVVAMIFLVIDVEIVFFYPWATIFGPAMQDADTSMDARLLVRLLVFTLFMVVGYIYAWGKGVFRWD